MLAKLARLNPSVDACHRRKCSLKDKRGTLQPIGEKAWNCHDLDKIPSRYGDTVVLLSPVAVKLPNDPLGIVTGKDALGAYFQRGLSASAGDEEAARERIVI